MIEQDVPDDERDLEFVKDWVSLPWPDCIYRLMDEAANDDSPRMRITRTEDIEKLKRMVEP
jgi:hypothetical protein